MLLLHLVVQHRELQERAFLIGFKDALGEAKLVLEHVDVTPFFARAGLGKLASGCRPTSKMGSSLCDMGVMSLKAI